jgi:hypothetical protein
MIINLSSINLSKIVIHSILNLKFIFILCLFHFGFDGKAQSHRLTGAIFDSASFDKVQIISRSFKFREPPSSFSLKDFCPPAGNQDTTLSCTGWAIGYSAITTSFAYEFSLKHNVKQVRRSGMFIYNQIKTNCNSGTYIAVGLEYVKQNGVCLFSEFETLDCELLPNDQLKKKALECRLDSYFRLFDIQSSQDDKLRALKLSISSGKPVVACFAMANSFFSDQVAKTGFWSLSNNVSLRSDNHAICIIGYNDQTSTIEVLNSWGDQWGQSGYFSMSYDDFFRVCREAYVFKLNKSNFNLKVNIVGDVSLIRVYSAQNKSSSHEILPKDVRNDKLIVNGIYEGDYFKLRFSQLVKDSYLYVLNLRPDGSFESLFPLVGSNEATIVLQATQDLDLPKEADEGILADHKGLENLYILYAEQQIEDYNKVIQSLGSGNGDILSRIQRALGDRAIVLDMYRDIKEGLSTSNDSDKNVIVLQRIEVNVSVL